MNLADLLAPPRFLWPAVFVPLHVAAAVLLAAVLVAWVRRGHGRTLALGALVLVVGLIRVRRLAEGVPIDWVTVLQEGNGGATIRALHGDAHAGVAFDWLVDLATQGSSVPLLGVVRMNLQLAFVNVVAFGLIAAVGLGRLLLGPIAAVLLATQLNFAHAAVSELPSQLATFYLFAAVPAVGLLAEGDGARRWERLAALALLLVLAILLAYTRNELAVVGAVALMIAVPRVVLGEAAAGRHWRAVGARLLAYPRLALTAMFAATVGVDLLPRMGKVNWFLHGIAPFELVTLKLPATLATFFVPPAVIVLFLLGIFRAARYAGRVVGLAFALIILHRIYVQAAHNAFFEEFRYGTLWVPMVYLLALVGWAQLEDLAAAKVWPSWWRAVAAAALALGYTAQSQLAPGAYHMYGMDARHKHFFLARDQQEEVRYLLRQHEFRHLDCRFVTRVAVARFGTAPPFQWKWQYLFFDRRSLQVWVSPSAGQSFEELVAAMRKGAPCMLFYRGLDCNLADSDGCRAEASYPVVDEVRIPDLQYNDVPESGAHDPILTLGLYRLPG